MHYTECYYNEYRHAIVLCVVVLKAIILGVIIILNVVIMSVIVLNVVIQSVIILSVIIRSVVAPCNWESFHARQVLLLLLFCASGKA